MQTQTTDSQKWSIACDHEMSHVPSKLSIIYWSNSNRVSWTPGVPLLTH